MADSRTLRIVTAATFLPAFPLCVAHGVVSGSPAPAVGLVPLAFSAGAGIFINSRQSRSKQPSSEPEPEPQPELERGDAGESALEQEYERGPETEDTPQSREASDAPTPAPALASKSTPAHPFLVFAVDSILAAALMVVLVFTWIDSSSGSTNSAETAMLAAYATIPLLINFLIHLSLAVRELSRGLAIPRLTQYLAWQAVPPDCPNCGHQLRPDAPPRMPWLDEASLPRPHNLNLNLKTKLKSVKWKLPTVPKVKAPGWKTPAWFRNRGARGYAPLFVSTDPHHHDDDDDDVEEETDVPVAPYRDDPEAGGPSARLEDPETPQPEVIEIVGKKSKKLSRNSSSSHST
ncbi:hypothetical protein F4811DRAFT_510262 [Daldinia bambusicola]|nr:hypothetical protein F4811DRAFT_510262 [Daldinia bambusicola]